MKKISIVLCLCLLFTTGCIKRDSLEDITIYATAYPIEYIVDNLYGEHSEVESIYPNGVNINIYELNEKQIDTYSTGSMFVFNGLTREKNYVLEMVENNRSLMIIDASNTIEYTNSVEEVWLDPSNFLMMASNIKRGLDDYITNHYLKEEIEENYELLKVKVSNLDAKLKLLSEQSDSTLVVDNDLFKFLEKYGFNIISLDSDSVTDKIISDATNFLNSSDNKYILTINVDELNDIVKSIMENTKSEVLKIHSLSNLTDKEKSNKEDYITIFNQNIEQLKTALY